MSLRPHLAALVSVSLFLLPVGAQPQATPVAPNTPTQARAQANVVLGDSLQQMNVTIDRLHRALASLNVARWKAPGDVRQTMQSDLDSMQRDLAGTLPSLVNTALANPAKVGPAFSVYSNVDALYDVLLRVSETAQLAGASSDAAVLEDQRASLEDSRTQLGAALLQSCQTQDAELVQLRTAATAPAPVTQPTKTVVDDGPATKSKSATKRTRKPAPTPPPAAPQQ